jgi:hypothetical protein
MLTRTSGITIPRDYYLYQQIEKDLTRIVYQWNGDKSVIRFFENVDGGIMIPRFYPINDEINDIRCVGDKIDIEDCIVPRNKRQKDSIEYLVNNNSCVLRLDPAAGKTVISIAAISKIKRKAIIFAHKTELLDQWKSEILKFTTLSDSDVGKLSSDRDIYDVVFKKKIIISTPHVIYIAAKKNNTDFLKALSCAGIGVCFIDECHIGVGPEEFSKSSIFLNCMLIYGLSATPARQDGNTDIIEYHLGKVVYFPPEEGERINPKIIMVRMPFHIYEGGNISNLMWGGKFNNSRYWNMVSKNLGYAKKVATLVKKAYAQGRTILVLSNRINSLLNIAEQCSLPKCDVGFFTPGAMAQKKRVLKFSDTLDLKEAFKTKRVVFATYGAAREGNSRDDLDFLILAIPTGNVEQAIGRIQRSMEGKKQPIVMDLIDTQSPLNRAKEKMFEVQANQRKSFYQKMGWEVKDTLFKN